MMSEAIHDPDVLFRLLSHLTDEDLPENEIDSQLYDELNALQGLVNRELLDLLEKTTFPRKYEIIDHVGELLLSVRLRMMIPELIDKYIVGFYHPGKTFRNWIWNRYLKEVFPEYQYGKTPILTGIPTLLVHDSGSELKIYALSAGEKRVELSNDEYMEMLYRDKAKADSDDHVEISSVAHLILLKSRHISPSQDILVLPRGCDEQGKYYQTALGLIDTLALSDVNIRYDDLNEILYDTNVKYVVGPNTYLSGKTLRLKHFSPLYITAKTSQELDDILAKNTAPCHNFNNHIVLESIISELFWYLGNERHFLNMRLEHINADLLNQNAKVSALVKSMKKAVLEQLDRSDQICKNLRSLLSEMNEHLQAIEELRGQDGKQINEHTLTNDDLSGHLFKMCVFYGETWYSDRTQAVRDLQSYCRKHGDRLIADIIVNDYFNQTSSTDALEYLKHYDSLNPYIGRLRLRHKEALQLNVDACGEIIALLPSPHTPEEQRLYGQYLYQNGNVDQARIELYSALAQGDNEAGCLFLKHFAGSTSIREDVALFGSAEAALQIGKDKSERWNRQPQSEQLFTEAIKFLNIAAAGGMEEAYFLLSNLWYRRGKDYIASYGENGSQTIKYFRACLHAAEEIAMDKRDYTLMGTAAFHLKEYNSAMEYLKKAETGDAHALRGYMYENGIGTAKNRSTALSQYEKAMNLGNTQARVNYDKLYAELAAEKKKKEESENQSYSSYTYYSGYYSYYSGW